MPMSGRYDAVLFDLDGTLLDTVPDLAAAANRMLAELGCPPVQDAVISTFVGRGISKLVERTLSGDVNGKVDAEKLAVGLKIFERCYAEESGNRSACYPGVEAGLRHLASARMPMAIVTNKAARFTGELLAKTHLANYFSAVVSGDTLPLRKPDPAPVLHACELLGVAAEHVLFVGDSRHDVGAARSAGCAIWCVPYGYNEGAPVASLNCDRIVPRIDVAAEWILNSGTSTVSAQSER